MNESPERRELIRHEGWGARRRGCPSEYLHPTRTELVALGERTREETPLEVSGNRVCDEISAIPDPDHTQEVRGSSPLAPTIPLFATFPGCCERLNLE
jgi:hypothetical protein